MLAMLLRLLFNPESFAWYRRWRGGKWWLCVGTHSEYKGICLWVNEQPPSFIRVAATEDYTAAPPSAAGEQTSRERS